MNTDNHECHVSIYAMCQEGMTLIKSKDVDLDKSKYFISDMDVILHSLYFKVP